MPTLAEAGFADAANPTWFGLFLAVRTPHEIADRLRQETMRALQSQKVRQKLTALGVDPMPMSADEFAAFVEKQATADAALIQILGLRSQ
ncbi:tripartite tricarboxylate transporter substrate-binding protein [Bradyrhizobium sp. sGM-13]|uniref:tripartite tricarboxylate transporter substrate-binding protein n=1 Tax=Bradyrhizobium sp. sGM-13 TaxID=2831781 RepID=UPI0035C8721A